jgi:hypothetical protein
VGDSSGHIFGCLRVLLLNFKFLLFEDIEIAFEHQGLFKDFLTDSSIFHYLFKIVFPENKIEMYSLLIMLLLLIAS